MFDKRLTYQKTGRKISPSRIYLAALCELYVVSLSSLLHSSSRALKAHLEKPTRKSNKNSSTCRLNGTREAAHVPITPTAPGEIADAEVPTADPVAHPRFATPMM